jgi:predicted CoA-binding protein
MTGNEWKSRILEDANAIASLLGTVKSVAVLGIKTEAQRDQAAFYVPSYAKRAGLTVIPVPVYFPDVTEILGEKVYRALKDVPGPIDLVDVFRRSGDVPQHVDDILAARPRAVWFQSGIRNDVVAERLAREGISVVQDRCLMVELRLIGK